MSVLLRRGSLGPEVVRLQTMLNKAVSPKPPLVPDGDFGKLTEAAVIAYQKAHRLEVDGIVGPKTWAALNEAARKPPANTPAGNVPGNSTSAAPRDLVDSAVAIALTQLGVREEPLGSNRGKKVDEYNTTAAVPPGSFWCMAFVYWCFVQASAKSGKPNPMPRTAYCPFLHTWATQHGKLTSSPQAGDIFLVMDGKTAYHTGLVVSVQGTNFKTIEGNSNDNGSHDGIGVFSITRNAGRCHFVRLAEAAHFQGGSMAPAAGSQKIAWGAKVTQEFKTKVIGIANQLGIDPSYLMACMAFETGETFSPSIRNAAGSGATGLIQFMPATARGLGTSTEALAAMTAVAQLDYVKKYFQPYSGRLKTLEDVYMTILYPAAVGKDANSTLFAGGTKAYQQNAGLDKNGDNRITPAEVSGIVRAKYNKGLTAANFG